MDLGFLGGGLVLNSTLLSGLVLLLLVVTSRYNLGSDLLVSLVKTFIGIDLYFKKRINKLAFNLQIEFWSQLSWFQLVSIENGYVRHRWETKDMTYVILSHFS